MEEKRLIPFVKLVDANALLEFIYNNVPEDEWLYNQYNADWIYSFIDSAPEVDAVEVVRCQHCVLHGNCYMEDAFAFAGAPNPFCCAGKRRTDG